MLSSSITLTHFQSSILDIYIKQVSLLPSCPLSSPRLLVRDCPRGRMPLSRPGNALPLTSIIVNIFAGAFGSFAEKCQWRSKKRDIASLAMAAAVQCTLALYDRAYSVETNPARRTWSARMRMTRRAEVLFSDLTGFTLFMHVVLLWYAMQSSSRGEFNSRPYTILLMAVSLPACFIGIYLATAIIKTRAAAAQTRAAAKRHVQISSISCN